MLVGPLDFTLDLVTFAVAIGALFFSFLIRNRFKEGLMWPAWRILGVTPLFFLIGESVHIVEEFLGASEALDYTYVVAELVFILLLMYGFYLFNKAWTPPKST